MSPEQVKGLKLDRRADLFSLGIVFHELLTGRRLFHRENQLAILHAVTEDPIPPVGPDVPEAIAKIVGGLLQRDPDDRPNSAADVREELLRVLAGMKYDEARVERHAARYLAHLFPRPEVKEEPPTPAPIAMMIPPEPPAKPARTVSPVMITAAAVVILVVTWLLVT
jgi:serine/threonine-protein kinase